ncbi:hypothetical protein T10_8717 [Trichinella papuae]|uniref:Uncharacterized protein n=1 Tax=Trichinella papuae TaxID=268474 RepID=A0A0V1M3X6_9BILA|nr:hypothetical protein T10_8717 [Trichinella papuae]
MEESGGQEHFCSFSPFHRGDIAFSIPAHRLNYVALSRSGSSSPAARKVAQNRRYQGCLKITDDSIWIELDLQSLGDKPVCAIVFPRR